MSILSRLALGVAASSSWFLVGCCAPDLAGVPVVIDVHASTFNSTDVPVRGFAARIRHLPDAVATLLGKVARRGAVGAQAEAIALRAELKARERWDPELDEARFVALRQRADLVPRTPSVHPDPLLDELMRDPAAAAGVAVALGVATDLGLTAKTEVLSESAARTVAIALKNYAPEFVGWLLQIRRSRWALTKRLGTDFPDVDLFTPALLDGGHWVDDWGYVPVATQLLLGEWIMRAQEGRVHFFAPFDPLAAHRSVQREDDAYFVTLTDAVMQRGFVGFQICPAFGFYPQGNAGRSPARPQRTAAEWEGIDRQLQRLYAFCAANEIPLLADVGSDLAAGPGFAERAAPAEWHEVLLAHRGDRPLHLGFAGGGDGRRDRARDVVTLINRFSGVFADFGNGARLQDPADRVAAGARIAAATGAGQAANRLMYGSHGSLFRRDWGERCAQRDVARLFTEGQVRRLDKRRFFADNAIAFLRLEHRQAGRDRLERFYARHGIPTPSVRWLDALRGLEAARAAAAGEPK